MKATINHYAQAIVELADEGHSHEALLKGLQNRGFSRWDELLAAVERAWKKAHSIREASVESATALTKDAREKLMKALGGEVELTETVNPELISGVRLRTEDVLVDGSVKTLVEKFRKYLKN